MKKVIMYGLVMLSFAFTGGEKMKKVKIGENIKVSLPENFYPMTDGDIATRMPTNKKPLAAYSDESRLVDFVVTSATARWRSNDLGIARDFFKANINHLYDEVDFIKEDIVTINKKEFAVFEFTSLVKGDDLSKKSIRKYGYIQYAIVNNRTLVFSFNAPYQIKDKWSETAAKIMSSLKIK